MSTIILRRVVTTNGPTRRSFGMRWRVVAAAARRRVGMMAGKSAGEDGPRRRIDTTSLSGEIVRIVRRNVAR